MAVDALRPFTQELRQALPLEDRPRFLRHLRPWWDVHRHRMPGPVADGIDAARASGQLRIHAGRICDYHTTEQAVDVLYRPRGSETIATLRVARVVNCSGPGADFERVAEPLIRALLRDGMVRPDALHLGLDVASSGAVRSRAGAVSRRLFAVGPVTKGTCWEMTAVPDIRRQCEALALHLARKQSRRCRYAT